MALCARNIRPLITSLKATSTIKLYWFADDGGGAGSTIEIKRWWNMLGTLGPDFGSFPNDKKRWIIAKPDKKESVKEVFKRTDINKTMEEKNHLRAVIGPQEYLKEFVCGEVSDLVSEIVQLAEFPQKQPKACYAAFNFGLKHRWTYIHTYIHILYLSSKFSVAVEPISSRKKKVKMK